MTVSQINPFIRFARYIMLLPTNQYHIAKDCRIFYILEAEDGNCIYIGKKQQTIKADSIVFIAANTPYKFSVNKPIKIISLNFDFTKYRQNKKVPFEIKKSPTAAQGGWTIPDEFFEDCAPLNRYVFLEDSSEFLEPLNKIVKNFSSQKFLSAELASATLALLIINVIRANEDFSFESTNHSKNASTIKRVKKYIAEHYKENLTNGLIAKQVDYHPYHLNRIFKNIEGVPLHKYLINHRVLKAEKLLLETDYSVTFIASEVGFENTTCFTQNFKAKNHFTPLKYRNFHRKSF